MVLVLRTVMVLSISRFTVANFFELTVGSVAKQTDGQTGRRNIRF